MAALHQTPEGIYFEQPAPLVIAGPPAPEPLGAAFQEGFEAFSIQVRDLRGAKGRRLASVPNIRPPVRGGLRAHFQPMQCSGLNASNAVVRAAMQHPAHEGIELSVAFNPLLPAAVVGAKLLELARVAQAISPAAPR